jgi:hypothetical protein
MEKTSGYITDVPYTYGYYRELSPCYMDFVLLLNGYEPPRRSSLHYLELGYGQGLSANIHAAANPGNFYGTDFNPAHAANAQTLAEVARSGAHFSDDSFASLADNGSLPEFDYITLHGVWSWINPDSREQITRIINKHLKVGGAVYMSYNVLPGWAPVAPLRHIMAVHIKLAGSDTQAFGERIDSAIEYARQLEKVGAHFFGANPTAKGRLDRIADQNRTYLAHEYFNEDWEPMYSSQVHECLAHHRATFACTATLIEGIDHINFTPDQAKLLASISNPIFRETTKDYLANAQFRRDLFTRGAQRLTMIEIIERLKQIRFALTESVDNFSYSLHTTAGKLGLKKEIYEPILAMLKEDGFAPKSFADIAARVETVALPSVIEAIAILAGMGLVSPCQADDNIKQASVSCDKLNAHLLEQSRLSGKCEYLASPVTGGGIRVDRFQQMFLLARRRGKEEPDAWAQDAWDNLAAQNQALLVEGKVLQGEADNLTELRKRAAAFAEKRLAMLQALKVAE